MAVKGDFLGHILALSERTNWSVRHLDSQSASVFSLDRRPQFHYSKPLSRLSLLFHSIFLNVTGRSESTALYSGAVSRNRNRTSS